MTAGDYIAIAITAVIIIVAVLYIAKAKRAGQGCIGCPYAKQCARAKKNGEDGCDCRK